MMIAPSANAFFSTGGLLPRALRGPLAPFVPALDRLLALDRLRSLYEQASACGHPEDLLETGLRLMETGYRVENGSLEWIPRSGPVLVTANHPFGLLEGMILAAVLPRIQHGAGRDSHPAPPGFRAN